MNVIIYGSPIPASGAELWSTNVFVTPIILYSLAILFRDLKKPKSVSLETAFSVCLSITLLYLATYSSTRLVNNFSPIKDLTQTSRYEDLRSDFTRFKCLTAATQSAFGEKKDSYFIASEYLMAPSMHVSHVSLNFLLNSEFKEKLLRDASGMLIYDSDLTPPIERIVRDYGYIESNQTCGDEYHLFSKS
jgi:hypothetical protein